VAGGAAGIVSRAFGVRSLMSGLPAAADLAIVWAGLSLNRVPNIVRNFSAGRVARELVAEDRIVGGVSPRSVWNAIAFGVAVPGVSPALGEVFTLGPVHTAARLDRIIAPSDRHCLNSLSSVERSSASC